MSNSSGIVAEVPWIVTPFRGDKFEAHWLPVAEAALDYGATGWALLRSKEGGLDFTQLAFMPSKLDFERYWYSEEVGRPARRSRAGSTGRSCPSSTSLAGMGSLAPRGPLAAASGAARRCGYARLRDAEARPGSSLRVALWLLGARRVLLAAPAVAPT